MQPQEKRILALDSQILDAIQKCSFYTFLNFVKNYRTNEKIAPLERGDLGHTILEVYYKLLKRGFNWDDAVEQATIKGREHYQTLSLDLDVCEWVIKTFHEYARYYKDDGIKILGVEESFSFVIYEDEELIIVYEGKIDLQAEFPVLGVSIMDHKWRAMKADYNPLDNQLIGYSIATNQNFIYINEVGLQKSYAAEKKFRRVTINIGDGVKARWLKNTIQWAKILDYNLQNNIWPQSHLKTAPLGITQCAKCQFNRICNSENDEEMARKIKDEFHIGEQWGVHKEEVEVE
jgi:hypothetical protein